MTPMLDVMLWGAKAGTLVESDSRRGPRICFFYDPDFVRTGYDIAPVRFPRGSVAARNGLPAYPEEDRLFGGLPSFIADSLPDRWGNVVFREWARSRGIPTRRLTALDRLAYIGVRGMGALEFMPPAADRPETPFRVELERLALIARKALAEAGDFHVSMSPDLEIESLFKVGTSAGGRRPKAIVNINPDTGECYSGQVSAPSPGFVPVIIKFDEHGDVPSTLIEYSYYLMAVDAGLTMMPSRVIKLGGSTHFLTERFDRFGGDKIHVQTLAAMDPLASSYDDLLRIGRILGVAPGEMDALFMQMTMNVVCGNVDDHNKNFSFVMGRDGVWHVAPCYDFTFAVDLSAPHYVNRHSMDVNGKTEGVTVADLQEVAARYDIAGASAMVARAREVASHYREYALRAGVPELWITLIGEEIAARSGAL